MEKLSEPKANRKTENRSEEVVRALVSGSRYVRFCIPYARQHDRL